MLEGPQPLRSTFSEGHVEADGFSIRYLEAGHGIAVVMLDSSKWGLSKFDEALAQQFHVVVLEPPGLGQSPANIKSRSVKELANTVAQAAAKIFKGPYTLIGTSFAANLALWQALHSPDMVEALVLISPTAILPVGDPTAASPDQLFAHPGVAQGLTPVAPDVIDKERTLVHRLQGTTHDTEAESRLGEIECPTLVVFGLKDRMVAPQAASIYREKIPNSNLSIVYDAGHAIAWERPEALAGVVADYVERRETFIVGRQSSVINP